MSTIQLAETVDVLGPRGIDPLRSREVIGTLIGEAIATLISLTEPVAWRAGELRLRRYDRTRRALSLADCILVASTGPGDGVRPWTPIWPRWRARSESRWSICSRASGR